MAEQKKLFPITWVANEIREWLATNTDEPSLAYAIAFVSNECPRMIDELDLEFGSVDEEIYSNLLDLLNELTDTVKSILEISPSYSDHSPRQAILLPFMERNGFYSGSGWWIRRKDNTII